MANKTKKSRITKSTIALIVCLVLIGALILATILMAVIPTDKGVKFSQPDQMTITYDGKTANFESDTDEFKSIWDEYKKAGNTSIIAALFGGYISQGMKANYFTSSQDYSNLDSSSSDEDSTSKNFVVRFVYNDTNPQKVKNGNGSDYEYKNASDTKLTFDFGAAYFEVTSDKSMQTKTFYLKTTLDNPSSSKTHITYTGVANFGSLYDLLKTMVENNKFI